jgi:ribonuclease HI
MKRVHAYVDGAAANNEDAKRRCGGWAVVLFVVDSEDRRDESKPKGYKELSGHAPGKTNNQMELEAIMHCLEALTLPNVDITIFSDSTYAIGVLSGTMKATANMPLIRKIQGLMSKHQVKFDKVKAHSGQHYNERADTLAQDQALTCGKVDRQMLDEWNSDDDDLPQIYND